MSPDYLSVCTREMSPAEKGPRCSQPAMLTQLWWLRSHMAFPGDEQRRTERGRKKTWATVETRDPRQCSCQDSRCSQRMQDSCAACTAPVLLIWGARQLPNAVCLQADTLLHPKSWQIHKWRHSLFFLSLPACWAAMKDILLETFILYGQAVPGLLANKQASYTLSSPWEQGYQN